MDVEIGIRSDWKYFNRPVYVWVVLYKPGVSEDNGGSTNTRDVEGGSFRMVPVVDHEVDDFCDVASIIEGPICKIN